MIDIEIHYLIVGIGIGICIGVLCGAIAHGIILRRTSKLPRPGVKK